MDNKAWLVDFDTAEWAHCYVVIWCDNRSDVRKILKHHMSTCGSTLAKINSIQPYEGKELPKSKGVVA